MQGVLRRTAGQARAAGGLGRDCPTSSSPRPWEPQTPNSRKFYILARASWYSASSLVRLKALRDDRTRALMPISAPTSSIAASLPPIAA